MLEDFTIRNFRGIKELTLPSLKRVNLFVGKNGVGKTSVLEAVWLAGRDFDPAAIAWLLHERNEVQASGSIHKAIESLFLDPVRDKALISSPTGRRRRGLYLTAWSQDLKFVGGSLGIFDGNGVIDNIPPDSLSQRPVETFGLDSKVVFLPATGFREKQLLELWQEIGPDGQVAIVEQVRPLAAEVDRIFVRSVEGQHLPMAEVGGKIIPLRRFGDGAVRRFMLAVGLWRSRGGLLLIDEIENGFHYSVQREVWDFLIEAATKLKVQVFATTHSRDTVYALAEASKKDDHIVYRIQRRRGDLHAVSFDSSELDFATTEELEVR